MNRGSITMNPVIVTVSRSGHMFDSMVSQLAARGVSWFGSNPGGSALAAIGRHAPDLVIVDSGTETEARVLQSVNRIKERYPTLPIFLIVRKSSEAMAIGALKAGVDDYFKAPFCTDDLLEEVCRKLPIDADRGQLDPGNDGFLAKMIGASRTMQDIKGLLARFAEVDSTVLITGETGTGKELAASLIHENSARARRPMVSVNCAALPDSLVESELFGYERGAFTGAATTTSGRFEQAHGGTVFLDEIGDMTPFAQAKILRVIEDKQIVHLGGGTPIPTDFRIIAATNRDPEALMQEGAFRDDLYYRLNVARVHMPSLRDHREDIPQLVDYGVRRLNKKFNRNIKGLKKNVVKLLLHYEWRGNVRELMNVLEGAYINLPSKHIDYADLPVHFKNKLSASKHLPSDERRRILDALLDTNWNKSTAAAKLKWSRMTLYRKMQNYHIIENRKPER